MRKEDDEEDDEDVFGLEREMSSAIDEQATENLTIYVT